MTERIKEISKNSVLPISLGLLMVIMVTMSTGVWTLAERVQEWESRLDNFEMKLGSRWSYYMERESWSEFTRENPGLKTPDIKSIRDDYDGVYR